MSKLISLTDKEIKLITGALSLFFVNTGKHNDRLIKKLTKTRTRIKVSSAKAKGRNLQKWAVEKIAGLLNEELSADKDMNNIRSREMGQSGVDIWLHKSIRNKFPIAVECKAQENISLNAFIEQAKSNTTHDLPYWLLIIKNKAIKNPIAVMDWELLEWFYYLNKWPN
jgi:hypothetical protein